MILVGKSIILLSFKNVIDMRLTWGWYKSKVIRDKMQYQFPRKQLDEFIFCKVQEYLSHFERSNLTHFPTYTCNYKIYQEFFQRKIFHVVLLSIFFNSHSMDHKIPTIDIFLRNFRIGFVRNYCSMKKRRHFSHID